MAAEAGEVLRRHGRSFHWASTFLTRAQAGDAASLYAFCRYVDDAVDQQEPASATRILADLRQELSGQQPRSRPVAAFLEMAERLAFPQGILEAFLQGMERDTHPVRFTSERELLRYAYGVASTVGLWMCHVLGVRDHRAYRHAIDLGIGMQLTNICRDVREDALRSRIYLPLPEGIRPGDVLTPKPPTCRAITTAVDSALDLADAYYRSAEEGMHFLPFRARLAILVASRVYRRIGAVIQGRADRSLNHRAFVTTAGKSWCTARALGAFAVRPDLWGLPAPAGHDHRLHAELDGLPFAGGA